ncbi:hypothetical protein Y032_0311g2145 [Ancylostoma ceylanicum]|uniref:Peptidase M13 N-terminal domain-containing protein n=1 Tax=Ancylostoma ceylanicum TaxID=53326 RepID=A0A016S241_9BILA|nr:hypothetical protein Y032_0311g2145 [Ancylostoma ceylanicum]
MRTKVLSSYGSFPLIDGNWDEETFDLTKLLAYFNRNKTINYALVPHIKADSLNVSRAAIVVMLSTHSQFSNKQGMISTVSLLNDTRVHSDFLRMLLNLTMQICIDTKSGCEHDQERLKEDIVELYGFALKLESTHYRGKNNYRHYRRFRHVEKLMEVVNWTEYFYLIGSPDVIPLIQPDFETITPSRRTMKEIDLLLRNTTGKVITNYVMLNYVLSWAEYLDDNYRSKIKWFVSQFHQSPAPRREFLCSLLTWNNYRDVMMAMHARQNKGRETKEFVMVMIDEIIAAFTSVIEQNTWIEEDEKQAILLKIRGVGRNVAYDDIHFLDSNQLDATFQHLIQIDLEGKSFLELTNMFYRIVSKELLSYLDSSKNFQKIMSRSLQHPQHFINAYYAPFANKMNINIGFLLFPAFGFTLPR